MAYDKTVDSQWLDNFLADCAGRIKKKASPPYDAKKYSTQTQDFQNAIDSIPTGGGGGSDVEIVDFVPPAIPTFKHQTGSFEIWGWGIKDEAQAWMSSYYTFHGKQYAGAIDDTDHEMTLTIVNGKAQGIPEMTRGKCIAIVR